MNNQGLAWLIYALVLSGILFFPSFVALIFARRWFIPVVVLNGAFFVDWSSGSAIVLAVALLAAVLWSVRLSPHLPAWVRPSRRRWVERQCPHCTHWMARTGAQCPTCRKLVDPLDQV